MTTRRTEFPGGDSQSHLPAADGFLVPGTVVGAGRYRLLGQVGVDDRVSAQLWRARDGQLNRDVALTMLVGALGDGVAAQAARRTLDRSAHAARLGHPGMARVLDVLTVGGGVNPDEGLLGIVVADWSQGTDLVDLIADRPLPPGSAARLLEPLAAAVELAHRSGLVLGVDHPQRIRLTTDGLRLAFPGPPPDATQRDDIKGLGAILYLMLTGTWPLPGGPDGVPRAPAGPNGMPVPPGTLRLQVPEELSMAAMRSLEDTSVGGIRTSATLMGVLGRVAEADQPTELIDRVVDNRGGPGGGHGSGYDDGQNTVWTTRPPTPDKARTRKLIIGVSALGVATLGVLIWIGTLLVGFFDDDSTGTAGPTVVATQPAENQPNAAPPQPAGPIQAASITVYNVKGDPDNAKRANSAADGNPKTAWKTSKYKQQFPVFKPGIGLIAAFAEPLKFATVTIDSPSAGTTVEIRTAPSDKPELAETKVIGTAELGAGRTEISLNNAEPTQFVIIWITKLGEGNISELTEVGFVRAQ
ncbi:MAG TPA: protein kinase family protein [Actinophytocola sp.]|uniref:protein kinase family protein n=1 Tax=Actinophytocola sp. TaxID=1872138 RepID=UPI002DB61CEB|nr:protein kinase family protein [Actinophytocola sp.]HEU5473115.1 protein kinase family protein [Actinophytocola sp.]